MRRHFAGVIEMGGGVGTASLPRTLEGQPARSVRSGGLSAAFTSDPPARGKPLIVFDGFLDNAPALGARLRMDARDPEALIAAAYARYGTDLLEHLRGDFALLLWDCDRREGLLARDRMGAGCVYVREEGSRLYFANELVHLLAVLPTRPVPDRAALAHWLSLRAPPAERTLFAAVRRLAPASVLSIGERQARPRRYWQPRFLEPTETPAEHLQRLRGELHAAVSARVHDQSRTGVLMSGGLDSAAVAALAAPLADDVLACSGVFPGHPAVDESELIATLVDRLSLSSLWCAVSPGGLVGSVVEHVRSFSVPPLGWGDFWTVPLLRAAAAEGVAVTLGGDGGDELFGARAYLAADELRAGRPRAAARTVGALPGVAGASRRDRLRLFAELGIAGALPCSLHRMRRALPLPRVAPEWLAPALRADLADSDDRDAWKRMEGPRWWAQPAWAITRGIEQAGVFEHQRQRAALAGLAARHPLLDPDLVECALLAPPRATFDPVLSRPLLREAMRGLLPDPVRLRPQKAWFDSLIVDCFTGPDAGPVRQLLLARDARTKALLRPGTSERTLAALGQRGGVERFRAMHLAWRLLGLECWLRLQEDPDAKALSDLPLSPPKVSITARARSVRASA